MSNGNGGAIAPIVGAGLGILAGGLVAYTALEMVKETGRIAKRKKVVGSSNKARQIVNKFI